MPKTLLIFIKNPVLGKAKTRLAKTIGNAAALAAYLELMTHTQRITSKLSDIRCQLWYSDFVDESDSWDTSIFEKKVQQGNDLGERMAFAFSSAFAEGAEEVAIIGSDCPYLEPDDIECAFRTLRRCEAVLGPTFDGGYYLLGLRQMQLSLFTNMAWSVETVAIETKKRLRAVGASCAMLPTLQDIDEAEDWFAWKNSGA